jgi:hypothetical protein
MLVALCAAPLVNAGLMWALRRLRRSPVARGL